MSLKLLTSSDTSLQWRWSNRFGRVSISSSFIVPDQRGIPNQLTAADYAAIDRETEQQMETEGALQSFFPLAFATSKESPLQFNFDLCLLDALKLPCSILESQDEEGQVTFESRLQAIEYCRKAMKQWKRENCAGPRTPHQPCRSHPEIDKERLFQSEGRSLESLMESKDQQYDGNLSWVREDRWDQDIIIIVKKALYWWLVRF